jgi:hypothetical protein
VSRQGLDQCCDGPRDTSVRRVSHEGVLTLTSIVIFSNCSQRFAGASTSHRRARTFLARFSTLVSFELAAPTSSSVVFFKMVTE